MSRSSDDTAEPQPDQENTSIWTQAKETVSSAIDTVENAVSSAVDSAGEIANNIVEKVEDSVSFVGETVSNAANSTCNTIDNAIFSTASASERTKPQNIDEKLENESAADIDAKYKDVMTGNTSIEDKKALYSELLKQGIQTGYWNNTEASNRLAELEANGFSDIDRSLAELHKQVAERKIDIEAGGDLADFHRYQKEVLNNLDNDAQLAIQNGRMTKEEYDNKLQELFSTRQYAKSAEETNSKVKDIRDTQQEVEQLINNFNDSKTHRGWLGAMWDGGKNLFGTSNGSDAVGKDLEAKRAKLAELMQNYDVNKDEINKLKDEMQARTTDYKAVLDGEVDMTADFTACAAGKVVEVIGGVFSLASFGALTPVAIAATAAVGSGLKMGIKATNAWSAGKEYNTAAYDAATGAVSAVILPGAGKAATFVLGKVGLSAAEKVVGETAIKTIGKQATEFVAQNETMSYADAKSKQIAADLTGTHTYAEYRPGEGTIAGAGLGIVGKVVGKTFGKIVNPTSKEGVNASWKGKDQVINEISVNPKETLTNITTRLEKLQADGKSLTKPEIEEWEKQLQAHSNIEHADTFNRPIADKYNRAKKILDDIKTKNNIQAENAFIENASKSDIVAAQDEYYRVAKEYGPFSKEATEASAKIKQIKDSKLGLVQRNNNVKQENVEQDLQIINDANIGNKSITDRKPDHGYRLRNIEKARRLTERSKINREPDLVASQDADSLKNVQIVKTTELPPQTKGAADVLSQSAEQLSPGDLNLPSSVESAIQKDLAQMKVLPEAISNAHVNRVYDVVRHPQTPYSPTDQVLPVSQVGKLHSSKYFDDTEALLEVGGGYAKDPKTGASLLEANGWIWRKPSNYSKSSETDRLSLNVVANKDMIEKLDDFMKKLNADGNGSYYKTSPSEQSWLKRHDPITVYMSKPLTPQQEKELADFTSKYIRAEKDNLTTYKGKSIAPGIAYEKYPSRENLEDMLKQAEEIDPKLGNSIKQYLENYNWNLSSGMAISVEQIIKHYRLL